MKLHFRNSNAVDYIATDLLRGKVNVQFANGSHYTYTNVSRRAILNLELNPNMSLGFWINDNCVQNNRTQVRGSRYAVA